MNVSCFRLSLSSSNDVMIQQERGHENPLAREIITRVSHLAREILLKLEPVNEHRQILIVVQPFEERRKEVITRKLLECMGRFICHFEDGKTIGQRKNSWREIRSDFKEKFFVHFWGEHEGVIYRGMEKTRWKKASKLPSKEKEEESGGKQKKVCSKSIAELFLKNNQDLCFQIGYDELRGVQVPQISDSLKSDAKEALQILHAEETKWLIKNIFEEFDPKFPRSMTVLFYDTGSQAQYFKNVKREKRVQGSLRRYLTYFTRDDLDDCSKRPAAFGHCRTAIKGRKGLIIAFEGVHRGDEYASDGSVVWAEIRGLSRAQEKARDERIQRELLPLIPLSSGHVPSKRARSPLLQEREDGSSKQACGSLGLSAASSSEDIAAILFNDAL